MDPANTLSRDSEEVRPGLRFTPNRTPGPVAHTPATCLATQGAICLSVPWSEPIPLEGASGVLRASALLSSVSCDSSSEKFRALYSELVSLPRVYLSRFPHLSSSPLYGSLALSLSDVDSHFSGLPLGRMDSWLPGVCASS